MLQRFTNKKMQNTNEKEHRVEKLIKRKNDKLYVYGKETIIHVITG